MKKAEQMLVDEKPFLSKAVLKELPRLKPCLECGGELEYWERDFVSCTNSVCTFTWELDRSEDL